MAIKKLQTDSLKSALSKMEVGTTAYPPADCKPSYVKRTCSDLSAEGMVFILSTRIGKMTITRLQ